MKLASIALFSAGASALTTRVEGGFRSQCTKVVVGPRPSDNLYELLATCGSQQRVGRILLDDCIANLNGRLRWQRG